jgi:hypothetical protein
VETAPTDPHTVIHAEERSSYEVQRDLETGEIVTVQTMRPATRRSEATGIVTFTATRNEMAIVSGRPETARVTSNVATAFERADWRVAAETTTWVTRRRRSFDLRWRVVAREGDTIVFERRGHQVIVPRSGRTATTVGREALTLAGQQDQSTR